MKVHGVNGSRARPPGLALALLAGGLDPDNVGTAIATVRPFGVDVSSGVEERPGVKSPAEVARFAAAARSAFEMIQQEQQSA